MKHITVVTVTLFLFCCSPSKPITASEDCKSLEITYSAQQKYFKCIRKNSNFSAVEKSPSEINKTAISACRANFTKDTKNISVKTRYLLFFDELLIALCKKEILKLSDFSGSAKDLEKTFNNAFDSLFQCINLKNQKFHKGYKKKFNCQ